MNPLDVVTDAVLDDLTTWDERDEADFIGITDEHYEGLLDSDYSALRQLEQDRVHDIWSDLAEEQRDHYYHQALTDPSGLTDTLHLHIS